MTYSLPFNNIFFIYSFNFRHGYVGDVQHSRTNSNWRSLAELVHLTTNNYANGISQTSD